MATVDGKDRVIATAQQILKSLNLNTSKDAREDMILILSSFDNRLSKIPDLLSSAGNGGNCIADDRFLEAEKVIIEFDSSRHSLPWEDSPDEADHYLSAVDDILRFVEDLPQGDFMDRAEDALEMAMSCLEDEFRQILIRKTVPFDAGRVYGSRRSFSISLASIDGGIEDFGSFGEVEKECCQVYSSVRRDVLDECMLILGVEKLSIEDVQRFERRTLDEKMKNWIRATRIVVRVLLFGEKQLCDQIFSSSESTCTI